MASYQEIVTRLRGQGAVDPGAAAPGPQAAVAAIVRPAGDLFFIVRAEHPKDPWSGHVAFPGGRRDPGDPDLVTTAIRETSEEVGVPLDPSYLVGRLPDVQAFQRARRADLVVTPFVFAVPDDVVITPNAEVAASIWVSVAELARAERDSFDLTYEGRSYTMPCLYLGPARHRLWGMTLRMLDTLLDSLK